MTTIKGIVNWIFDGDTIRVKVKNEYWILRLAFIDAPEKNQYMGNNSKWFLIKLIPPGTQIEFEIIDTDKYRRKVSLIYKNKELINNTMVRYGYAVVYYFYLAQNTDYARGLILAEDYAKRNKLNFWNQEIIIYPWDFRKYAKNNNNSIRSFKIS